MKLYKLPLNLMNNAVRKDLGNAYSMHASLANSLIGFDKDADARQYLYRLEFPNPRQAFVLLATDLEFDTEKRFSEGYLEEILEPKEYNPDFKKGDVCRFTLFGNVTKRISDGENGSKVIANYQNKPEGMLEENEEKLLNDPIFIQWLGRKEKQHGFKFNPDNLRMSYRNVWFKKTGLKNVPLFGVSFKGFLKVTDEELFQKALKTGIGRSKSMGFGLLTCIKVM